MAGPPDKPPPGLKSIHDAQAKRGRTQARVTPQAALFVLLTAAAVLIVFRMVAARQLDTAKDKLLQKQRAVEATVGAEWRPLRDKVEKLAVDAAGPFKGDFVDSEATRWDFRGVPGLYLRVRLTEARDVGHLREAARGSLRDAFVGCLLREPLRATAGEADGGLFPDQPWNLRQGYASTRILTDVWVKEVKEADDDLRLRVFEQQYDRAVRDEIPVAVDMVKRAQFFLLVLDEDAEGGAPPDGGAPTEESLQLVPHETRVVLFSLKTGAEVFRVKRTPQAAFYMAGEHAVSDPEVRAAMQRNVNNCDLAAQVRAAVDAKRAETGH